MHSGRVVLAVLVCAALATGPARGQSRPDFTGTWVVDELEAPETAGEAPGPAGMPGGGPGGWTGGGRHGGEGERDRAGGGPPEGGRAVIAGPEIGQKVVIKQTADRLIVRTSAPGGDQMLSYALDGRETTNMLGPATIKSKTKWEGATLVTDSTAKIEGPHGNVSLKRREVRSLDNDGETMIVKTTTDTPRGKRTATIVYRRAG